MVAFLFWLLLVVVSVFASDEVGSTDDGDDNLERCREECAESVGSSLVRITHCDRGCHMAAHVWQLATSPGVPPRPFAAIESECMLRCRAAEDDVMGGGVDEDVVANCGAGCAIFVALPTLCALNTFIGADASRPSSCARCPAGTYHPMASETDDGAMLVNGPCIRCPADWWLPARLRSELSATLDSSQHCSVCMVLPCSVLLAFAAAAVAAVGCAWRILGAMTTSQQRRLARAERDGGELDADDNHSVMQLRRRAAMPQSADAQV